jgi:hypothetical protein
MWFDVLFERNSYEKNENSEKCFGSLNKWCKTKRNRECKMQKKQAIDTNSSLMYNSKKQTSINYYYN